MKAPAPQPGSVSRIARVGDKCFRMRSENHRNGWSLASWRVEVIDARMARATNEVSHWDGYDYVLVNDDVEQCFQGVKTILQAERLKRSRQTGLIGFIRKLTTK